MPSRYRKLADTLIAARIVNASPMFNRGTLMQFMACVHAVMTWGCLQDPHFNSSQFLHYVKSQMKESH
jgi:hypothetical protein